MTRSSIGRATLVVLALLTGAAGAARVDRWQQGVTPALVARGDSIFHGKLLGGSCYSCHQANAKGLPGLAPDLTDASWLDSDGSLAGIARTVTAGVADPRTVPAPMPRCGGATLTPDQARAVAAYVWSLSHPLPPTR